MAFTARSRAEIRDSLLANWSSRYAARGMTLLTVEGSDAYMTAEGLAVELEGIEAQAASGTTQILPDKAATEYLDRHGDVEGVVREAAVPAVLTVRVTGTASTNFPVTGKTLNSNAGLRFTPIDSNGIPLTSVTTNGSGIADILSRCDQAGPTGNLANGTTLTWSSAPSGMSATGTVQGNPVTIGAEKEEDFAYARRIIAKRQERPASGNRADWRDWAEAVDGVEEAYVYPLLHGDFGPHTIGAVTVVILGPKQGSSPTNTRILTTTETTRVSQYIEGTHDKAGIAVALANQKQLRPVTIKLSNYVINYASPSLTNVTLQVKNSAAYAFPFTGTMTITGTPNTTTVVVTGDHTAKLGKPMLLPVSTSVARGGFIMSTPTNAVFGGGNTTFTFPVLVAAPTAAGTIYPAPSNWSEIRDAVFEYFDSLGPGDVNTSLYPESARYPGEEVQGRATLYRPALAGAVVAQFDDRGELHCGVKGVLSANVSTPATDTVPAYTALIVLDVLTVVSL
jgi:uncharacterized phage protein gp47/JayE